MRPLAEMPKDALRQIDFIFCDIDETLTNNGRLRARAYAALEAAASAGLCLVPVTGRPAGWCDLIVRQWPVAAVIGENGAFSFRHDPQGGLIRDYWQADAVRRENSERLRAIAHAICAKVPGAAIAADQSYRDADFAIDYAEDIAALPPARVAEIIAAFQAAGANAQMSSAHVNAWFGDYDKLATSRRLLARAFGLDFNAVQPRLAYLGDAPNDAPMFEAFANSIGVANVRRFVARLPLPPAYVTVGEGGEGFAEFVALLLAARS